MSWYRNGNDSNEKPSAFDEDTSHYVVFVRKDFEQKEITDEQTGEKRMVWEWMETKIPKEDWEVYKQCLENAQDITDLQLALVEVYEQIGG